MRKIEEGDKRDIFDRWLDGESYRQISEEKDIGLASINRIIDELRNHSPDIDELRKLRVRLKEKGRTVFEVLRACPLQEQLNNYGVGIGELKQYVDLSKRILSDKKLQDNVMTYAVKLIQLEQKYGKPYEEVTEDFNELVKEIEERKTENAELKQENTGLKKEAEKKARSNRQLDEESAEISKKLAKVTATHEKLRNFGHEKLHKLADFVEEINSLGFSVEEIQKLVVLRQELTKLGINPNKLENDTLRIKSLSIRANELESRVESLDNTINQLSNTHTSLLAAQGMLRTNSVGMPCRNCGQIINLALPTKQHYSDVFSSGMSLSLPCPHCGAPQVFSMPDIATRVGWLFFP